MPNDRRTKIGVLVSGNGSNLQAIIDSIEAGVIKAEIVCVISNKPDAFALIRARRHEISAILLENRGFSNRHDYDAALISRLKEYQVDLVLLAGFMRILSEEVINAFTNRIMNIHPALLPSFPGLHAQKQAIDYGVRFSGCTVHFVDSGTDTGPIIMQAVVPVEDNDNEETLSARILKEEHRIYSEAVRLFCNGLLKVEGRKVKLLPS